MGYGSWDSTAYTTRSTEYKSKSRQELFKSREILKEFDPRFIRTREARDSEDSPNSTPMIFALDVTGSMGQIAEIIAKEGLGTLVNGILDTNPVTNPHMMIMAVGDIQWDSAPLQATQFEVDALDKQLTELWLEGGGGGNSYESYDLPWIFAAHKTSTDAWEKRKQKGYLFTIGDEEFPRSGSNDLVNDTLNLHFTQRSDAKAHLKAAQEKYHVFHVVVEEGNHCQWAGVDRVVRSWKKLGKHLIRLNDYEKVAEVIISVVRVNEGEHPDAVIESWQDERAKRAVKYSLYTN